MLDHPDERTVLLAKEKRPKKMQNQTSTTSSNDESIESTTGSSITQEAITDYGELEFKFSLKYLNLYLIEPLVCTLLFAYNLSSTILQNQIIYQTCTAIFQYNETDCRLLGTKNATNHTKGIETEVQPYVARILMTSNLLESIVPAVCGVFIGAWSDRFGRKPLLLAAFIGYALYYFICGCIAYLASLHPVSPWYYLLALLPHTLLGGTVTYSVAAYCFLTDVTSTMNRPYRMVFYEAAVYIGLMSGSFVAGFLFEATNSIVVFGTSAACIAFGACIIGLFLPESLHYHLRFVFSENVERHENSAAAPSSTTADRNRLEQLFDMNLVQQMWTACFKPRSFSDRGILWLIISTMLIAVFTINGSMTVFYLFVREQLNWSVRQYTTYETFSVLIPIVGNLLGICILRKVLNVSLIHLAIIAFLSQGASCLLKGFALETWHLYLAMVVGALKSLGNPMSRTAIANLVPSDELGKIFSFQSVLQALVPIVASPVYAFVYSVTLSSFPGFFNVLSANLLFVAISLFLVVLRKKHHYPEYYDSILS